MVVKKLFKTKLCLLYQKGHCNRQTCSFAHGNAELRRSFNGRRDGDSSDLREKLDRRHSPMHRYSPGRDERGRHVTHGDSPRSLESMRKRRKKEHLDVQSDYSGSLRFPEGTEDKVNDSRQISSESKDILNEQLRRAQSEISMLVDHKRKLEIYLEERILEENTLNSRIQDLEVELAQEKEESKRTTSKIKKFIKAFHRQSRLEEELKRSRVQLEKITEQLALDATLPDANDEDADLNHGSGEVRTSRNELHKNASPISKRLRVQNEGNEIYIQANLTKGKGKVSGKNGVDKHSRWSAASDSNRNNESLPSSDWMHTSRLSTDEFNSRRSEVMPTEVALHDKSKLSELCITMPSTSMAAHAIDDEVDNVEMDEKLEAVNTAIRSETEVTFKYHSLPPPPLPPAPFLENAYEQYKGDEENVNIDDGIEEELEVDIV